MALPAPSDPPPASQLRRAAERRYVTVLFSDVCGSSEHAEQLEAEDYAELLARFREFAREIIPRHGGSIARLQGDGLLALFGHLTTREDDGRRAVEAALELHQAVAALRNGSGMHARPLQLHSGIHSGLVLVLEGDIERGRFDVVGEVPNTAARLCSMAGAGETLVSDESLGPGAHFFRLKQRGALPIRGRANPVPVLSIEGRLGVARRLDAASRRGSVQFIGREAVLGRLAQALDEAMRGARPVTAVLSGEPGIGKTRSIEEFVAQAGAALPALRVLRGSCENYLTAEPLQFLMQWIRQVLDWRSGAALEDNAAAVEAALTRHALADEDAAALRALLGLPGAGAPASAGRSQRAVVRLLAGLGSEAAPLLLVIDDFQWADDPSREVLSRLQELPLRALILVGMRPASEVDPSLAAARLLELGPLSEAEALSTVGFWLPHLDPFLAQEIVAKSGGSPLFIEELCHAVASGRGLHADNHLARIAWINALVASRLETLPAELLACLQAAAVIGYRMDIATLQELAGRATVAALVEALQDIDFLQFDAEAQTLRFKHALTRDAVYATVELQRRRTLHGALARGLEATAGEHRPPELLGMLAHHFDAAGEAEAAARYAELAGDQALAAMALDRARAHYTAALRAIDQLPAHTAESRARWCRIAQRLGQTCVFDALDVTDSLPLFQRAAALAREAADENAIARAEYWLAYVYYGKGLPRRAVQHCEQALSHARTSGEARLVAQLEATLGQSLASAGQYERALPLLRSAVESKREQSRPGSGTAIGSAYTRARTGYTLGDIGRFAEAQQCFDEALQLLGDTPHAVRASILELICAVHLWQGRWTDARVAGELGVEIAWRCRSRFNTVMGRALAACGGWAETGNTAALDALRESTRWIERQGGGISTSLNYGWLVEATAGLGLHAEARTHAARLLQRVRLQDRQGEGQGRRALALLAAQRRDFGAAARQLAAADRGAIARGSLRETALNQLCRGELALLAGRAGEARDQAQGALEQLEQMQMAWHADAARRLAAC